MALHPLLAPLAYADRRSIHGVAGVLAAYHAGSLRLRDLWAGLATHDPGLRMRCIDAVEKLTRENPSVLCPYAAAILRGASRPDPPEIRWHWLQLLGRLTLTPAQAQRARRLLIRASRDDSRIVATMALQSLFDLSQQRPTWRKDTRRRLQSGLRDPRPSVRARCRRLLRE
jgi:hypothetical protein